MMLVSLLSDSLIGRIIHPFSCAPNDRIARDCRVCGIRLEGHDQPYGNLKKSLNTAHMFSILLCE